MIITLGGLGFWVVIDFLFILFGLMDDAECLPVKRWGAKSSLLTFLLTAVFGYSLYLTYIKVREGVSVRSITSFVRNFDFEFEVPSNFSDFSPSTPSSSSSEPFKPLKPVERKASENDLVSWVDDKGVKHYVNDLEKVPAKYRKKARVKPDLPNINWVPGDKSE
jgi:hypothetical protein